MCNLFFAEGEKNVRSLQFVDLPRPIGRLRRDGATCIQSDKHLKKAKAFGMGNNSDKSAPARPLVMMPQSVLDGISAIERAIALQTKWFKNWHEQVICNHDLAGFDVNAVRDLPLGKWFESEESKPFRNNPGFMILGERLEEIVTQVRVFLGESEGDAPHPVDSYTHFMNTLMDLNTQVQQLQNDAWRGLTRMDPLTGVRNRHDMMAELDVERERARRSADACSVAMVDLDHFKALNDTHGHVVGDQVLRHISALFGEQLRPYDMVYRYGGEEFLLCLPNTDAKTATMVLDRLRVKISQTPMPYAKDGEPFFLSASFGVTEIDTVEHIVKSIERADMALYDVKQKGRNAVGIWEASLERMG